MRILFCASHCTQRERALHSLPCEGDTAAADADYTSEQSGSMGVAEPLSGRFLRDWQGVIDSRTDRQTHTGELLRSGEEMVVVHFRSDGLYYCLQLFLSALTSRLLKRTLFLSLFSLSLSLSCSLALSCSLCLSLSLCLQSPFSRHTLESSHARSLA